MSLEFKNDGAAGVDPGGLGVDTGVTRRSSRCLSPGHTDRQTAVIARTRKRFRVHNEAAVHVFGCGKDRREGNQTRNLFAVRRPAVNLGEL